MSYVVCLTNPPPATPHIPLHSNFPCSEMTKHAMRGLEEGLQVHAALSDTVTSTPILIDIVMMVMMMMMMMIIISTKIDWCKRQRRSWESARQRDTLEHAPRDHTMHCNMISLTQCNRLLNTILRDIIATL